MRKSDRDAEQRASRMLPVPPPRQFQSTRLIEHHQCGKTSQAEFFEPVEQPNSTHNNPAAARTDNHAATTAAGNGRHHPLPIHFLNES